MFRNCVQGFPRRDPKPKKRLQENRTIPRIIVVDLNYRPVLSESLLGLRVSSGEFRDCVVCRRLSRICLFGPGVRNTRVEKMTPVPGTSGSQPPPYEKSVVVLSIRRNTLERAIPEEGPLSLRAQPEQILI